MYTCKYIEGIEWQPECQKYIGIDIRPQCFILLLFCINSIYFYSLYTWLNLEEHKVLLKQDLWIWDGIIGMQPKSLVFKVV